PFLRGFLVRGVLLPGLVFLLLLGLLLLGLGGGVLLQLERRRFAGHVIELDDEIVLPRCEVLIRPVAVLIDLNPIPLELRGLLRLRCEFGRDLGVLVLRGCAVLRRPHHIAVLLDDELLLLGADVDEAGRGVIVLDDHPEFGLFPVLHGFGIDFGFERDLVLGTFSARRLLIGDRCGRRGLGLRLLGGGRSFVSPTAAD